MRFSWCKALRHIQTHDLYCWMVCVRTCVFCSDFFSHESSSPSAVFICNFNVPCYAAHIPLYLYPFLNTATKTAPFQKLRFTSLGVIGALVKVESRNCIKLLAVTKIKDRFFTGCLGVFTCAGRWSNRHQLPVAHGNHTAVPSDNGVWCASLQDGLLICMLEYLSKDTGSRHGPKIRSLKKISLNQNIHPQVSTFIMQKILLDDRGLKYVCQTAERFFAVSNVLRHE